MIDAVAMARANTVRECSEIVRSCYAAGHINLAGKFIADATPLHAVKNRLAAIGVQPLVTSRPSIQEELNAAIRASGRPWAS